MFIPLGFTARFRTPRRPPVAIARRSTSRGVVWSLSRATSQRSAVPTTEARQAAPSAKCTDRSEVSWTTWPGKDRGKGVIRDHIIYICDYICVLYIYNKI